MSAEAEFQTSMEAGEKLEIVHQAIQKILAEKTNKEDQLLLSGLLSELESVKEARQESAEEEASNNLADERMEKKKEKEDGNIEEGSEDDIVKELKKVKRQNFITHCLLSAMIVLTVTWQLSEVSLLLRLQERLSHPFRSIGSMLAGMIKGPDRGSPASDKEEHLVEMPSIPIKIPEFPHLDSEDKS